MWKQELHRSNMTNKSIIYYILYKMSLEKPLKLLENLKLCKILTDKILIFFSFFLILSFFKYLFILSKIKILLLYFYF